MALFLSCIWGDTGYQLGIFFTWFLGCCTLSAEIVALLTTLKSFLPIFNQQLLWGRCFGLIVLFAVINFSGRGLVKTGLIMYQRLRRFFTLISSLLSVRYYFFIHKANFSPVIPQAALKGPMPFYSSLWRSLYSDLLSFYWFFIFTNCC